MESDEFNLRNLREWQPINDVFQKIPTKIQKGFFFQELNITCIDALPAFLALGSDVGIVFWYNRRNGNVQKLRTESTAAITCIRLVDSVEYMVAAGNAHGEVSIFQIQKELPSDLTSQEIAIASLITSKPIERYTIKDAYRGAITCVEWSKNGMKLFSGDNHGIVVLTELDFGQHISKSFEVINEKFGIVQLQFSKPWLLVSTLYRAVVCKKDASGQWKISQIGRTDRKVLNDFGAVFTPIDVNHPKPPSIVCTRPGFRFWLADIDGNVSHTFLLKESVNEVRTIYEVPILNPVHNKRLNVKDTYFGPCFYYMGKYIVTYCESMVFIVNLEKLKVMATIKRLRNIQYLTINGNEIFIVEGGRSIVRISTVPEGVGMANNTKYVPFNGNLNLSDSTIEIQEEAITQADECFELPPIETIRLNVPLACQIGENHMLQQDKLLLEHSKKLEIFEKINTLDYDDSILFRAGTKKKKNTSVRSMSSDETKVDGIVEIGRQVEFFNDKTEGFATTNKEIVNHELPIGSFTESTTKPCLMQASFCDFIPNSQDTFAEHSERKLNEPNPEEIKSNGTTPRSNVKVQQKGGVHSKNYAKGMSHSLQTNSMNRSHFKPLEFDFPLHSSGTLFNSKQLRLSKNNVIDGISTKTILSNVPPLKLMYPIGNRLNYSSTISPNRFQHRDEIIDGITMESPPSEVAPLTGDDEDYDQNAIDSLDVIRQCVKNTPPKQSIAKNDSNNINYLSSLVNLPKLWDIKIEQCDDNQYNNGKTASNSNDNSTKEGSDSEWVFL